MKIEVTRFVESKEDVHTIAYDLALPVDCITDLSVELRGFKEWSAYCCFTNGVTMQVENDNGVGSIDFTRNFDVVIEGADGEPRTVGKCISVYYEDDETVVIDENGTGWSSEDLYNGLQMVVQGEE